MARALVRARAGKGRLARVRNIHVIWDGDAKTLCGQGTAPAPNSAAVILDPLPRHTPEGLSWCPVCTGRLAERCGLLAEMAERLAAREAGAAGPADGVMTVATTVRLPEGLHRDLREIAYRGGRTSVNDLLVRGAYLARREFWHLLAIDYSPP